MKTVTATRDEGAARTIEFRPGEVRSEILTVR
jgi:hypothetical protein